MLPQRNSLLSYTTMSICELEAASVLIKLDREVLVLCYITP